jgi:hypothetical protein
MVQGHVTEACRELAESQRLDPGGGTLLNLAVCHEREGRTASAWAEFNEALPLAIRAGRVDRAKLARERIAALEPVLSKIRIDVPSSVDSVDLEIRRDETVVRRPAWGMAMPVDPGAHVVSAVAPGKRAWSTTVTLTAGGAVVSVVVPELEREPPAIPPPVIAPAVSVEPTIVAAPPPSRGPIVTPDVPAQDEAPSFGSVARRPIGVATLGVGAAGVVVGAVAGAIAVSKHDQASAYCTGTLCHDPRGITLNDESAHAGTISTIAFVTGGVGLAAFGVLWWIAPRTSTSGLSVVPRAGTRSAGIFLDGTF